MYNNQSELVSVDTVISKSQDKGAQILIEDNKRDYYSFFKNKQDGSPTAAFSTFQQFRVGEAVTIVFKNVPYKGKNLRSVVKFRAVDANRPSPARQSTPQVPSAPADPDMALVGWYKTNHAATWAAILGKIKVAYDIANPPVNSMSGDEINVEDIPF